MRAGALDTRYSTPRGASTITGTVAGTGTVPVPVLCPGSPGVFFPVKRHREVPGHTRDTFTGVCVSRLPRCLFTGVCVLSVVEILCVPAPPVSFYRYIPGPWTAHLPGGSLVCS